MKSINNWSTFKKNANILILVLFIMFISSLLGLLVTQYVRNMIKISGIFRDYYTTYYYAYAGLELGLAQIQYREKNSEKPFGYEEQVVFDGFSECNGDCSFDMEISSRSSVVTDSFEDGIENCVDTNFGLFGQTIANGRSPVEGRGRPDAYNIGTGDGFIVPLFYDTTTGFMSTDYQVIEAPQFVDLNPDLYNDIGVISPDDVDEEYIVRIIDENTSNYLVTYDATIDVSDPTPLDLDAQDELNSYVGGTDGFGNPNKNYLVVANPDGNEKDFCLQVSPVSGATITELPSKYITIRSIATLNDANVSFGAVKNNDLPSFVIYGTISTSN